MKTIGLLTLLHLGNIFAFERPIYRMYDGQEAYNFRSQPMSKWSENDVKQFIHLMRFDEAELKEIKKSKSENFFDLMYFVMMNEKKMPDSYKKISSYLSGHRDLQKMIIQHQESRQGIMATSAHCLGINFDEHGSLGIAKKMSKFPLIPLVDVRNARDAESLFFHLLEKKEGKTKEDYRLAYEEMRQVFKRQQSMVERLEHIKQSHQLISLSKKDHRHNFFMFEKGKQSLDP